MQQKDSQKLNVAKGLLNDKNSKMAAESGKMLGKKLKYQKSSKTLKVSNVSLEAKSMKN